MNERQFGKYQAQLQANGIVDADVRESFSNIVGEIFKLADDFDFEYWQDQEDYEEELLRNYVKINEDVLANIFNGLQVDGEHISSDIDFLISVLDGGDMDDSFGTEGWRHHFGWDE